MNLFCKLFVFLLLCSICLEASSSKEGRITGGEKAEPHSHPYVVSLQSRRNWKRYRICTGSILSERWILSSGHCVTDSFAKWYPMDAIIGAHNLEEIYSSMIYPISHRIAHPKYRGGVGPYDISMMRTSRDIEFSERAQPISLPPPIPTYEVADDLLITGWGALQHTYFVIVIPNKLREANVTYLPYNDCYRAVHNIKDYYEHNPLRRYHNLCTGPIYGGLAGCTGDSGGPLVQNLPATDVTMTIAPEETTTDMTTTEMTTDKSTTSSPMSPTPMTTGRPSTTSTMMSTPTSTTTESHTTPTIPETETSPAIETTTPAIPDAESSPVTEPTIPAIPEAETFPVTEPTTPTIPEIDSSPTVETTTPSVEEVTTAFRKRLYNQRSLEAKYVNNKRKNKKPLRVELMPTVVGVVSWGVVPCGIRGAPTVYSNVTHYMDFINHYLNM